MSAAGGAPRGAMAVEWMGWAAVATALLFQNPYGELGPEPDRFLVLQILALAALVSAALVSPGGALAALRPGGSPEGRGALALSRWALALGATAALSTLTSVDPLRSLFGAPPRLFGLASELALLVLFFVLAPHLATAASRDRGETAVLAATGALLAYAVLQWAGLDPLRWQVDWQGRPTAAQGNPLFLAQALVWLVPIAAGRAFARRRAGERGPALAAAGLAVAGVAVAVRTGARGPLLGLAVAGALFAAVAGLSSPSRRGRRAGAAVAGLLALALVAGGWIAVQRLDRWTGTASQRLLLWSSVVRLFEASPASRHLVGFGPESLPIVLPPYLPPELPERIWRPDLYHDRAHNSLLDALASGGWLRLLAGLGLAAVAALGVLRLAGVRRRPRAEDASGEGPVGAGERWRFTALAAAFGGHAVAALSGVPTAATATLTWFGLALVAGALGSPAEEVRPPAASGRKAVEADRRGADAAARMKWGLAALLLAIVAFGAWVPAQQEGDAMGGRVLLLLILAAGGIRMGFVSGVARGANLAAKAAVEIAPGRAKRAGIALLAIVALASLVFVQLPQIASGVALKQGRTALDTGRADLAVPLLARALASFPNFEDSAVALARAEQRLAERAADEPGRVAAFDRAAAILADAHRRHPGLAQLALEEAHLAARRADSTADPQEQRRLFELAVASFREVEALDPQSSTVHRGLGTALLALGRVDEAGIELETSVRLAPRSLESRLLLGRQRLAIGEEAAARSAFEAAREIDRVRARQLLEGLVRGRPADPSALRDLALFEIVEGRRDEAIAALQRAMALTAPQDLPPLVRLIALSSAQP